MENKICKNCTFYTAYYKQWSSCYGRLNYGFCSKNHKEQKQIESCEEFKSNECKEKMREKRRLENLEQAIKAIIDISQILKEKEKEKD